MKHEQKANKQRINSESDGYGGARGWVGLYIAHHMGLIRIFWG